MHKNVIIVDDDPFCRDAMVHVVSKQNPNWIVHSMSTGSEALDLIEELHGNDQHIAMCILDVNLEHESGTDVVRTLRQCERAAPLIPRTRVMGISGDISTRTRSLSAGMDEFHVKPLTLKHFRKA